jgi:phage tail-like protein
MASDKRRPAGKKAAMTTPASPIIGVTRIVLSIDGTDVATFSELTGISSEVEPAVPDVSPTGIVNTKQFGTASQTVTLKRAVDGSTGIWAWHQAVLAGDPAARKTCLLKLQNASGQVLLSFVLENAWPSKVDIAGPQVMAAAGPIAGTVPVPVPLPAPVAQSQVMMETDEIVCDSILMQLG